MYCISDPILNSEKYIYSETFGNRPLSCPNRSSSLILNMQQGMEDQEKEENQFNPNVQWHDVKSTFDPELGYTSNNEKIIKNTKSSENTPKIIFYQTCSQSSFTDYPFFHNKNSFEDSASPIVMLCTSSEADDTRREFKEQNNTFNQWIDEDHTETHNQHNNTEKWGTCCYNEWFEQKEQQHYPNTEVNCERFNDCTQAETLPCNNSKMSIDNAPCMQKTIYLPCFNDNFVCPLCVRASHGCGKEAVREVVRNNDECCCSKKHLHFNKQQYYSPCSSHVNSCGCSQSENYHTPHQHNQLFEYSIFNSGDLLCNPASTCLHHHSTPCKQFKRKCYCQEHKTRTDDNLDKNFKDNQFGEKNINKRLAHKETWAMKYNKYQRKQNYQKLGLCFKCGEKMEISKKGSMGRKRTGRSVCKRQHQRVPKQVSPNSEKIVPAVKYYSLDEEVVTNITDDHRNICKHLQNSFEVICPSSHSELQCPPSQHSNPYSHHSDAYNIPTHPHPVHTPPHLFYYFHPQHPHHSYHHSPTHSFYHSFQHPQISNLADLPDSKFSQQDFNQPRLPEINRILQEYASDESDKGQFEIKTDSAHADSNFFSLKLKKDKDFAVSTPVNDIFVRGHSLERSDSMVYEDPSICKLLDSSYNKRNNTQKHRDKRASCKYSGRFKNSTGFECSLSQKSQSNKTRLGTGSSILAELNLIEKETKSLEDQLKMAIRKKQSLANNLQKDNLEQHKTNREEMIKQLRIDKTYKDLGPDLRYLREEDMRTNSIHRKDRKPSKKIQKTKSKSLKFRKKNSQHSSRVGKIAMNFEDKAAYVRNTRENDKQSDRLAYTLPKYPFKKTNYPQKFLIQKPNFKAVLQKDSFPFIQQFHQNNHCSYRSFCKSSKESFKPLHGNLLKTLRLDQDLSDHSCYHDSHDLHFFQNPLNHLLHHRSATSCVDYQRSYLPGQEEINYNHHCGHKYKIPTNFSPLRGHARAQFHTDNHTFSHTSNHTYTDGYWKEIFARRDKQD